MEGGNRRARGRPLPWDKSRQAPVDRRARRRGAQPDAERRMPDSLTECEHETLAGRELRLVAGYMDDVKRLEVRPQGMGRIRHTAMGERVAAHQKAELTVHPVKLHAHPRTSDR